MTDEVGDEDEDIPFTFEANATADTARQMARAGRSWSWRQRATHILLGCSAAVCSLSAFSMYAGDGVSTKQRILGSLFWGGLVAALLFGGFSLLAVPLNTRSLKRTVHAGRVQRSGFGTRGFVTQNDLSSTRYSYRAVRSVDAYGGFVFIRYVGQPVVRIYPQSLFPASAMTRLQEAVAQHE